MAISTGQVRYFVAVADDGQITRAARRLNVAQPALSQAIALLEEELGVELLERHPRGVTLTPAGEVFLAKARAALAADEDAALTAQRLARAARGALEVGFVGAPPMVLAPDAFAAFSASHPEAQLSFHDLHFPRGSTASWLGEVDIGLCYSPSPHPDVSLQKLRDDPRVLIVPAGHQLAAREELAVAEVLEETFVGFHPDVEPGWASILTLDDHRDGGHARVTEEGALDALEMLTIIASGRGVLAMGASHGAIVASVLPNVAVIPLPDANPTALTLVWRNDTHHPLVDSLVQIARELHP